MRKFSRNSIPKNNSRSSKQIHLPSGSAPNRYHPIPPPHAVEDDRNVLRCGLPVVSAVHWIIFGSWV